MRPSRSTTRRPATYYIMLKGYVAYAGVTLKATYTPVPEQVTDAAERRRGHRPVRRLRQREVLQDRRARRPGPAQDRDVRRHRRRGSVRPQGLQAHADELGLSSLPHRQQRDGRGRESRRRHVVHHAAGLPGLHRRDAQGRISAGPGEGDACSMNGVAGPGAWPGRRARRSSSRSRCPPDRTS